MKILDENLTKVSNKTFPGSNIFKLYDTMVSFRSNCRWLKSMELKLSNVILKKRWKKAKPLLELI